MSTGPEFATLTDDDLVTGEAVALDLPPASLGSRMLSGLIDIIATIATLVIVVLLLLPIAIQTDAALMWVAYIGTMITVFLVVPTTLETLTRGRSLGKMAMGLRTVRDDAGPISFQHAFVRALIGFVEIYAFSGVPAFFAALLSSKGKRLGDYAAGTYVVRERVVLRLPMPAAHAAAAGPLGSRRRHRLAADRPRGRRTPVPRPLRADRPGRAARPGRPAGRAGAPIRRPRAAAWHTARGVPGRRDRGPARP